MNAFASDPESFMDLVCIHTSGSAIAASSTVDLDDVKKIDIAQYEHVYLVVAKSGGTSTALVTPKNADGRSTAEFPLDGTGGVPDFRMSFTAGAFESRQRAIRTRGRRRFLQLAVTTGAGTGAWLVIYLMCFRPRAGSGQALDTNLTSLGLT